MSQPVAWLAIDPGTRESGYVVYACGQILSSGVLPNADLLRLVQRTEAPRLVIEMVESYGMAVGRDVFETVVWIGRFLQTWKDPDAVLRLGRRVVKMHLCHSARAKDANIWQALVDRFGEPGTKSCPGRLYGVRSHARAALALAVTADDQARQPLGMTA